jgi:hypothetical protein
VLGLPSAFLGWLGISLLDGGRGEPHRDAASIDECLIVFSGVGPTMFGLVMWVDSRPFRGHGPISCFNQDDYRHTRIGGGDPCNSTS